MSRFGGVQHLDVLIISAVPLNSALFVAIVVADEHFRSSLFPVMLQLQKSEKW
jgi:hypothetical protein